MPEDDSRQGLDLDVSHRLPLRLGEPTHLLLREADVVQIARGHPADLRFDLGRSQPERRRRVAVEALRQFAHRRVAAGFDLAQSRLDDPPHHSVVTVPGALRLAAFQVLDHDDSSPGYAGERIR